MHQTPEFRGGEVFVILAHLGARNIQGGGGGAFFHGGGGGGG